ncbi:MAG: hypothetical protein ACR2NZ_01700 [Rubripirellula sp.]
MNRITMRAENEAVNPKNRLNRYTLSATSAGVRESPRGRAKAMTPITSVDHPPRSPS